MPLLYLENLPVPLNGLLGGLAFLRWAVPAPALAWPGCRQIFRELFRSGRVRRPRLGWRQTIAYLRLRRSIFATLRDPNRPPD